MHAREKRVLGWRHFLFKQSDQAGLTEKVTVKQR